MAREDRMGKYDPNNLTKEQKQEVLEGKKEAEQLLASSISDSWEKKQSKPTMEQTHSRTSFLFRKDLKARLDRLADIYGRGYRSHFLNKAIEMALESAENELEED